MEEETRVEEEELKVKQDGHDEDEDFSWGGCVVVVALFIVALWALIHFNPSEQDHRDAINEVVREARAEMLADGYVMTGSTNRALRGIKYHSIGVCSWTTTTYRGSMKLTSVGILGWTYPLVAFE